MVTMLALAPFSKGVDAMIVQELFIYQAGILSTASGCLQLVAPG